MIEQVQLGTIDWTRYGAGALVGVGLSLSGIPGLGVIVGISMYLGIGIVLPYGFGAIARELAAYRLGPEWCEATGVPRGGGADRRRRTLHPAFRYPHRVGGVAMSGQAFAVCLMAAGSVTALVAAAGPIQQSVALATVYSLAVVAIGVGAVLRRQPGQGSIQTGSPRPDALDPLGLLRPLADVIEAAWEDGLERTFNADFSQALADATDPPIREFLRRRQAFCDHLGMERSADLMIRFAAVERLINRARSAAADGAAEEARESLDLARHAMAFCLACPGVAESSPTEREAAR